MKYLILALIQISILNYGLSQSKAEPCGTQGVDPSLVAEWRKAYDAGKTHTKTNEYTYIWMKIHSVSNDNGNGHYNPKLLLASLHKLNNDMVGSGIQVLLDLDINYINSSYYNDFDDYRVGNELMTRHYAPNRLNSYLMSNPRGVCGYYTNRFDAVGMNKSCMGPNSSTWAHELGHFFTLNHTFYGWEGSIINIGDTAHTYIHGENIEKVDGSNCAHVADGFCDTKPDYLSNRWTCSNGKSGTLYDPDTVPFEVDGTNVMSYSNDGCVEHFTTEQMDAMNYDIEVRRQNLVAENFSPSEVVFSSGDLSVVQGANDEPLPADQATVIWNAIPGASAYVVEITEFFPFARQPDATLIVTDTFCTFDFLEEGKMYEWEITPFNEYDFDNESSEIHRFTASMPTSTTEFLNRKLQIYPNPVGKGEFIFVDFEDQVVDARLEVTDLSGRNVLTQGAIQSNHEKVHIDLPAGIYLVHFINENRIHTQKMVVH